MREGECRDIIVYIVCPSQVSRITMSDNSYVHVIAVVLQHGRVHITYRVEHYTRSLEEKCGRPRDRYMYI